MKRGFFRAVVLMSLSVSGSALAAVQRNEECYEVKRGDTLQRVSRALRSGISDLAKLNGIKDINRIYPGQKICSGSQEESDGVKTETSRGSVPVDQQEVKSHAEGNYKSYSDTNVNPLVPMRERRPRGISRWEVDALGTMGIDTKFVSDALAKGNVDQAELPSGTRFEAMSERGKGKRSHKITTRRVATWKTPEPATLITLPDGRKLARLDSCYNWTLLEESHAAPSQEFRGDVALAAVSKPQEEEEKKAQQGCSVDDYDLFLSRGGTRGNGSSTTYNNASGFACLIKRRVDGGTVVGGIEGMAGNWKGSADDGFRYKGRRFGIGPSGKDIDDDGWDLRLGYLFGRVTNDGHSADGKYVQERNFLGHGPSLGINLYQRELAGEKWFPKTQIYASIMKLTSPSLRHSWEGKAIADTSDLKSSSLLSGGIRQFIYQGPVKPWVSAEYFAEIPMTRNATLMFGVTDENEIFWAGLGKTWDLKNAGSARSWMVGLDVGNGVRTIRKHERRREWIEAETSYYDPETGAFSTNKKESRDPEGTKITPASNDAEAGNIVEASSQKTTPVERQSKNVSKVQAASQSQHGLSQNFRSGEVSGWGDRSEIVSVLISSSPITSSVVSAASVPARGIDAYGWGDK